jgi:hypothetical protein
VEVNDKRKQKETILLRIYKEIKVMRTKIGKKIRTTETKKEGRRS